MKKEMKILLLSGAMLLMAGLFWSCGAKKTDDGSAEVVLHTTKGDVVLILDGRTPLHRDNFLKLVRDGVYDSVLFHRVIADFMVQAGDPTSKLAASGAMLGEGDLGYTIPSEIVYPELTHVRGSVAAARMPDAVNANRESSSSQFYIVWGRTMTDEQLDRAQQRITDATGGAVSMPDALRTAYKNTGGTPHLDGQYTVFGHVTKGMEVVESIQGVKTDAMDRPLEDVRIISAEITREPKTK